MRPKTVVTSNIVRLSSALDRISERNSGEEGMVLLTGRTGEGKTTAATFVAAKTNALCIKAGAMWGTRKLIERLSTGFGLETFHRMDNMVEGIVEMLLTKPQPIFIDELDYIFARPRALDVIRDIYDEARVPIVLSGSDQIPPRLRSHPKHGRFARRVSQWITFHGMTQADSSKIIEEYAECGIDKKLQQALHRTSEGNAAALKAGIHVVELFAVANDLQEVTAKEWGRRPLPSPSSKGYAYGDS